MTRLKSYHHDEFREWYDDIPAMREAERTVFDVQGWGRILRRPLLSIKEVIEGQRIVVFQYARNFKGIFNCG